MNKNEFLELLNKKLNTLSKKERKERISFYSEMIDDYIEEGLSEEDAINKIGDINEIVKSINIEVNTENKKKYKVWELVLLIIGSPIWVPILLTVLIVVFAVNISLWAIEIPFLIFAFLSKYLFIICKKVSKWSYVFTKGLLKRVGFAFSRKG